MATNTSGGRTTQEDLEKILELDPDDVVFGDSEEPEGYPELLPGEDDDGDELRGGGQVRGGNHVGPKDPKTGSQCPLCHRCQRTTRTSTSTRS